MKIEKNSAGHIVSGTCEHDKDRRIFDYYIGIDPDVNKSGFASWNKPTKTLTQVTTVSFFDLFDTLNDSLRLNLFPIVMHIEGGWLNEKSNFRQIAGTKTAGERIAKNVGANHQIGKLIIEMCIYLNISFIVRKPITPRFANQKYFKLVTGWQKQTNADARSAANYVYGF